MSKQTRKPIRVVKAKAVNHRDDMALRKVARAVIAIAERQLRQEAAESAASKEKGEGR